MKQNNQIKAEAFDIMQYFYCSVHEPFIHCVIHFGGRIDEPVLKRAVDLSISHFPLIACSFDSEKYCWHKRDFTSEDIVQKVTENDEEKTIEKTIEKLLVSSIDIFWEPQLKIFLVEGKSGNAICVIINHMLCDGAGFKQLLYYLGEMYSQCEFSSSMGKGVPLSVGQKCGNRSMRQLTDNFKFKQKLSILFSKSDSKKSKSELPCFLQGDKTNPFMAAYCIPKQQFADVKAYAKKMRVTINDMILTAYMRTLRQYTGSSEITVPCPVDLRKYLQYDSKIGICNLTSNLTCKVVVNENDSFEKTLQAVSMQMRMQKSSLSCLKGPILLSLAFKILPVKMVRRIFFKLFTIPVVSYTNLGIVDQSLLKFGNTPVCDCFFSTAVKYVPYFQLSVSTYDDRCTLSCSMHGTPQDKVKIENFLRETAAQVLVNAITA